jgi:hypothetical protein
MKEYLVINEDLLEKNMTIFKYEYYTILWLIIQKNYVEFAIC